MSGLLGLSAQFFSEGVHNAIRSINESKSVVAACVAKSQSDTALVLAASGAAAGTASALATASAVASSSSTSIAKDVSKTVAKQGTKDLKYNPFGPEIFVETGKVVGSNSTRLAGQVIVGVSAAFLVWDVVDLGFTVTNLIRKKGSQAAAVLREKADQLEAALAETKSKYELGMMPDE